MSRLFVPMQSLKAPGEGAWSRLAAILPMLDGVTLLGPGQYRPGAGDLVWTTLDMASPFRSDQVIDLAGDGLVSAGPLRRLLARRCLRKAVHVVVETDALRRDLVEKRGVDGRKISVIPIHRERSGADAARDYANLFRRLGVTVSLRERGSEIRPRRRAVPIGLNPLPAE